MPSSNSAAARRRERTRSEVTLWARRLTAEHGTAGFTVEELCDKVGISRRTFFNYFASKDDAVLGVASEHDEQIEQEFLRAGAGHPLSLPELADDLVRFAIEYFELLGMRPEHARDLIAAVHREPKLLPALLHAGEERERRLVTVIAEREGRSPDDSELATLVALVGTILHRGVNRFIADDTRPFGDYVQAELRAARAAFAPTPTR